MTKYEGQDHYLDPGTGVLKNKLGIRDENELKDALHPFRDGNGRAQREFINHLAYKNGYFIEWKNVSQRDMIQASLKSFHQGDNSRFAALLGCKVFENEMTMVIS